MKIKYNDKCLFPHQTLVLKPDPKFFGYSFKTKQHPLIVEDDSFITFINIRGLLHEWLFRHSYSKSYIKTILSVSKFLHRNGVISNEEEKYLLGDYNEGYGISIPKDGFHKFYHQEFGIDHKDSDDRIDYRNISFNTKSITMSIYKTFKYDFTNYPDLIKNNYGLDKETYRKLKHLINSTFFQRSNRYVYITITNTKETNFSINAESIKTISMWASTIPFDIDSILIKHNFKYNTKEKQFFLTANINELDCISEFIDNNTNYNYRINANININDIINNYDKILKGMNYDQE